jgi:hypothetical protein
MRFLGGPLVLTLAISILGAIGAGAWVTQGADFDIEFQREALSSEPREELERALTDTASWPRWFHSLKAVEALQGSLHSELLTLKIEPPKKQWKRFDLSVQVMDSTPKRLRIHVLDDSIGKLSRLFSNLEWTVELLPAEGGQTRIVGTCRARTLHWRSRLFGKLSPRILMNQVFYPNVIALSQITRLGSPKGYLDLSP